MGTALSESEDGATTRKPGIRFCAPNFLKGAVDLRNRKSFPCFYKFHGISWVTRVEVWANEKSCCGNTRQTRVFPQLFRALKSFQEYYNNSKTKKENGTSSRRKWNAQFLFGYFGYLFSGNFPFKKTKLVLPYTFQPKFPDFGVNGKEPKSPLSVSLVHLRLEAHVYKNSFSKVLFHLIANTKTIGDGVSCTHCKYVVKTMRFQKSPTFETVFGNLR